MFAVFRPLAALATLILLTGCYTSDFALLTPAEADYPFPARVEYTRTDTAGVATQGTLRREGDHYVRTQPGLDQETTLLFQHLRDEFYLVQESNVQGGAVPITISSASGRTSSSSTICAAAKLRTRPPSPPAR